MSQLHFKQFKKDSFIYGVGGAFTKGLGLILLPLYTRLFTPAEYGIIEILTISSTVLGLCLNMGLDSSQSYFFYEQKKEGGKLQQARLVRAILQWRLSVGLLITIIAIGISPLLSAWIFDAKLDWSLFAVTFAGTFFFQITIQSAQVFQLIFRPWYFLGITFFQSLLSAAIAILMIVWLDMGVLGYFVGFSVGSLVAAFMGWWLAREYVDWSSWNMQLWPRILKFGLPFVPAYLAEYLIETSDRWFMGIYHGTTALGIYAVGVKFALALSLVVEPFRKACDPLAMKALQEPENQEFLPVMARLYMGVGAAAVVVLTALSPLLVKWFTVPAYYDSYQVIGLLAWKQLFFGFYLFSVLGFMKKENTKLAAMLTAVSAIFNICLQFILVPKYGGLGAALSLLITNFIWNILTMMVGQRQFRINYPWAVLTGQVMLGFFATGMLLLFFKEDGGVLGASIFCATSALILIVSSVQFGQLKKWCKNLNGQSNE